MSDLVVLVIDDDASVHREVDRVLGPPLIDRVEHAMLPGDGIRLALDVCPDLILLDIHMPEMDGFKVCRALKENSATRDIPILFLTVETKSDHIARALDCGGVDYVSKPFDRVELQARIRVALRVKQLIGLLREQARVDALTGLLNRSALDDALRAVSSSYERNGISASLLMIDIDHFKAINDRYGHGVGDEALRAVGASIRACCRPYDFPCRFGGDEFGIILEQTDAAGALAATQRMIRAIREIRVPAGERQVSLTASAGLVSIDDTVEPFEPAELMKAADAALYQAKNQGRDRIVAVPLASLTSAQD